VNAERLHALVVRIRNELERTQAVEDVEAIAGALNRVMQQGSGQSQQNLADALTAFRNGMAESDVANWSPAWVELLKEIGYRDVLGDELRARIENIVGRNEITPAIAKQEVDEINGRLQTLRESVNQLRGALTNLHIGAEALEPGQCEIGFLIPRPAVDNELDELGEEFGEVDKILRTISEIATGDGSPVKIRTISSTDFMLFVTQLPAAAALLAFLVDKLVVGYKNILEVRKLHGELSERMRKKSIKEIETFAEGEMMEVINAAVDEAMKQYGKKDQGRRNELRTALEKVLRKLADRIDRGFNIEVRIEPLPAPKGDEEADPKAEVMRQEHEKHRQVIQSAAKQLEFLRIEGQPILHLESPPDSPKKKNEE
jgi:hypothetical protein